MTRLGLVLGATALVVLGGAAAAYAFVVKAGPNPARGTIAFVGRDTIQHCHGTDSDAGPIYTVPAQGGVRKLLLPGAKWVHPTWSPDGKSLAVGLVACGSTLRTSLAVADPATGRVRLLTHGPGDGQPAWSPDGRTIAFVRQSKGATRLYSVPAAGGATRPIGNVRNVAAPSWSADGRSLVVARPGGTGTHPLYVLRRDGTDLRQLTTGLVLDRDPAWSPDGKWIAFGRWHFADSVGLGAGDWLPDGVYLVRPDGSQEHRLSNWLMATSWSPDSRSLVGSALMRSTAPDSLTVGLQVLRAHGLLAGTHYRRWTVTSLDGQFDMQPTWKAQ